MDKLWVSRRISWEVHQHPECGLQSPLRLGPCLLPPALMELPPHTHPTLSLKFFLPEVFPGVPSAWNILFPHLPDSSFRFHLIGHFLKETTTIHGMPHSSVYSHNDNFFNQTNIFIWKPFNVGKRQPLALPLPTPSTIFQSQLLCSHCLSSKCARSHSKH